MNSVNLVGRTTRELDVRYTNDDLAIARFTLAVDRNKDNTDFIPCVAMGKTAEFMEKHMENKGVRIWVSGHMQSGQYKNKDGDTVYTLECFAHRVGFADSPKQEEKPRGRKR